MKLGGAVRMTITNTTGDDVSGTCNVTASFPTGDGQYSYRVVVSPGSVSQPAVFSGTNVVREYRCVQLVLCQYQFLIKTALCTAL